MVREPLVFLFDEPLSNLDAGLRAQMRIEIGGLQRRLKTTMIYVTHDQVEAMAMGDRVVVMNKGILHQIGTPTEVYDNPADSFVATFLGSPPMNLAEIGEAVGLSSRALRSGRIPRPARVPFSFRVESQEYLGVDTLAYLELDRLVDATGAVGAGFCNACLTGDYPVAIPENLHKGVLEHGDEVSETRVAAPRLLDAEDARLPADVARED
jgi:multiple sugar transport system ATP-binding protein